MAQGTFFEAGQFGASQAVLTDARMADWPLDASWAPLRTQFLASPAGQSLSLFLSERLAAGARIYPPQPFRALQLTELAAVRVVIIGQDPYHGAGQAHGLAFSVPPGQRPPPSLRNIFKELARDPGVQSKAGAGASGPESPSLEAWARQGVLLLNTCLSVEDGRPASHAGRGWEPFTDALIQAVDAQPQPVVFMLWGAHAQAKAGLIDSARHLVLSANHPSPLSANRPPRPFMGCGHFSQANAWLLEKGSKAIDW